MSNIMHDQLVRMITAQVLEKLNDKVLKDNTLDLQTNVSSDQSGNNNIRISDQNENKIKIEGVITARKLEGCHSVQISRSSIITPSAKDFIKEKKLLFLIRMPKPRLIIN